MNNKVNWFSIWIIVSTHTGILASFQWNTEIHMVPWMSHESFKIFLFFAFSQLLLHFYPNVRQFAKPWHNLLNKILRKRKNQKNIINYGKMCSSPESVVRSSKFLIKSWILLEDHLLHVNFEALEYFCAFLLKQ